MRRPQSRDHHVANDSGRFGRGGQRTLLLDFEGGAVLDASNQRRVCSDNLGEEFIVGVAAINDVEPPRLEPPRSARPVRSTRPVSGWHRQERP